MDDIMKVARLQGILTGFIAGRFYEDKLSINDMLNLEEMIKSVNIDISDSMIGYIFKELKKKGYDRNH